MRNAEGTVDMIGFDSGWGSRSYGCEDGPYAVALDQLLAGLRTQGLQTKWRGPLGLKFLGDHRLLTTKEATLPLAAESIGRLCRCVKDSVESGCIPIVIGGDHSSAIGTWAGVAAATNSFQKLGLIWIDAHLDSHTYETSYQGKWGGWWHGQPVTALLGYGLRELKDIGGAGAKISPQHLSMIGIHSFEPAEEEFIKKHNIRVYSLAEVRRRGFKEVFEEAKKRALNGTQGFGLSVDLDAFQPSDAPGVGAAEDEGLIASEVIPVMKSIGRHPLFRALEIAEFNPHKDRNYKTAQLLEKVVESVFTKD